MRSLPPRLQKKTNKQTKRTNEKKQEKTYQEKKNILTTKHISQDSGQDRTCSNIRNYSLCFNESLFKLIVTYKKHILLATNVLYFWENVNVFMFFNFEPNFIQKFLRESVFFFKFWSRDFFHEAKNFFFGLHFKTKHFLIVLFADIWLFWVYAHMVQVSCRNFLREIAQKWMGSSGPLPLVHKREWKVA